MLGPVTDAGRAIALIGGADGMGEADRSALRGFFATLAAYLEATGTAVVDGGTDSGVMRLIGEAWAERGGTFRLVGVVPEGALARSTRDGAAIELAPGHEILTVPGDQFGDESSWLFAAADHLAGGAAPTIVVNGGQLTLDEAEDRLAASRRVVVVGGSGRAADTLAAGAPRRTGGGLHVLAATASAREIAEALGAGPVGANERREDRMTSTARTDAATRDRLGAMVETLDLDPFRKELLRQRWLDQVAWISAQARKMRVRYYVLRLPVVVGGVTIPALISVSLGAAAGQIEDFRIVTFWISLGVAVLAALEAIFQYGDRWRHYRRTAERLKSLGWQYFQLNGAFRRHASHDAAFVAFTERVEEILGEDVEGYLGQMSGDPPDRGMRGLAG